MRGIYIGLVSTLSFNYKVSIQSPKCLGISPHVLFDDVNVAIFKRKVHANVSFQLEVGWYAAHSERDIETWASNFELGMVHGDCVGQNYKRTDFLA